jgi:sugar/nucleoside kinase (ribokinase family)
VTVATVEAGVSLARRRWTWPQQFLTRRFAELANQMDVAVAFDVNLRADLWDGLDAFGEAVEPCSTARPSSS